MKTLLITLLMLVGVLSSNQSTDNDLLIARVEIYINQDDMLYVKHEVRPPYFTYDYEVEYKLFEKFVLEYPEEELLKWVKQIKETQRNKELIRKI